MTIASIIMLTYIVSALILFAIFCRYRTGYRDGEWVAIITPGMNTIIALIVIVMWIMYLIDKIRE